eukprot:3753706-Pyramimonas_sp.AAC.2
MTSLVLLASSFQTRVERFGLGTPSKEGVGGGVFGAGAIAGGSLRWFPWRGQRNRVEHGAYSCDIARHADCGRRGPQLFCSTALFNIHTAALNIHTAALNISVIALNIHIVALNIHIISLSIHTTALNIHTAALNIGGIALNIHIISP